MLIIDKYSYTNKIKNWNPLFKSCIFLAGILFSRINIYCGAIVILMMTFFTVCIAKIRFYNFIRLFKIPLFFAVAGILGILITVNSKTNLWEYKIGGIVLGISYGSIKQSAELFFIVLSSIASLYFFILTTPIMQFIKLLKKIKTPSIVIELMLLIYRSIFIFLDEYLSMHKAEILKFGSRNKKLMIKSMAVIAVNLFSRIFIKHQEMSIALELKLYDGIFRTGD